MSTGDPHRDPDDPLGAARQAFVDRTTLGAAAAARLRDGIVAEAGPALARREAYLEATTPTPHTLSRVHGAVVRSALSDGDRPRRGRFVLAGALAAAGAVAVAVAVGVGVGVAGRDYGAELATHQGSQATLALQHVALNFDGEGHLGGTEQAPVIAWEQGTISVSVTPHQGVDLRVTTPEATVEVVGTVFAVGRAHHATRIDVSHGTVRVTCADGAPIAVTAGQHRTCLPADLSSLLLRVSELTQTSAPADERMDSVDAALARADGADMASIRAELLAHRARALSDAGRTDEALADAEAYLATREDARRAELSAFVARARYERVGCAAEPELERATAASPLGAEALTLAACLAERDPQRALSLAKAAAPTATGEWRTIAERLITRLEAGSSGGDGGGTP